MKNSAHSLKGFSYIKVILVWTLVLLIGVGGYFGYNNYISTSSNTGDKKVEKTTDTTNGIDTEATNIDDDSFGITDESGALNSKKQEKDSLLSDKTQNDPQNTNENFNILVLGIDRRHAGQTNWRTDVIQLVTLRKDRKKAVVTHIPRDVWATNYKINAVYNLKGPDAIKDEVFKITGQRPDRIVRVDFDAFVYAVDMVGGVEVDNPNEFTDEGYPNDRSGEEKLISITFPKGEQSMDGETALQYVRSRKGTNGEGSDYARGKRQQIIMQTVVKDFFKPTNMFQPKTAETLYRIATEKVYTDISLKDTQVLFELLKGYKDIKVENFGLDTTNFLTVPNDKSSYGGAWTLVPVGGNYDAVKQKLDQLLQAL